MDSTKSARSSTEASNPSAPPMTKQAGRPHAVIRVLNPALSSACPPRSRATTKASRGTAAKSATPSRRLTSAAEPRASATSISVSRGRNRALYRSNKANSGPSRRRPTAITCTRRSGLALPLRPALNTPSRRTGRVAQRESTSLTRRGSQVQSLSRPPPAPAEQSDQSASAVPILASAPLILVANAGIRDRRGDSQRCSLSRYR
jgi:hypothetical protein